MDGDLNGGGWFGDVLFSGALVKRKESAARLFEIRAFHATQTMPSSLTDVFDKGGISVQSLHEELSQMDRSVFGIKLSEHLRLVATSKYSESAFIFQGSKGTQKVWRAMADNDMLVLFSAGDSNGAITVSDNANLLLPSTRQLTDELSLKKPEHVLEETNGHAIMSKDTKEDYLLRLRDWRCHLLSGSHESTSNMLKGVVAWAVNGYTPRETMTVNIVVENDDGGRDHSMIDRVAEDIQYWLSTLHAPATEMTSSLPHMYHTMKVFCLRNAIAGNTPSRLQIKNFDPEHKLRFVIGTSAEFEIWNKGTKNSGQVYVLYGNNAVQHYVDRVQTHASPSKLVTIVQRKGGRNQFTPQKTMEYYKKIMMARSPDHKKVYTHWGCIPESAYITPDGDTARTDYMTTVFRKLLESLRPSQHFDNKGGSAITWGGTYDGVSGGGDCGDEYGVHTYEHIETNERFEEQANLFSKFLAGQIQQNAKQEIDDEFNTMPAEKQEFKHDLRMVMEKNTDNRNDRMRSDTYHVQNFPSMSGKVDFGEQTTKSNLHWHAGHRCFNNNNMDENVMKELNLTMSFFSGGLDMLELYEVEHEESNSSIASIVGDSGIDDRQRNVDSSSSDMQTEVIQDPFNGVSKFFPLYNSMRWLSRPFNTNVTQGQVQNSNTTHFITPSPLALLMGAKVSGVYGNAFVGEMYSNPDADGNNSTNEYGVVNGTDDNIVAIPLNTLDKNGKIKYDFMAHYQLEGGTHIKRSSPNPNMTQIGEDLANLKSPGAIFVDGKVKELNAAAVAVVHIEDGKAIIQKAKKSSSVRTSSNTNADTEKITDLRNQVQRRESDNASLRSQLQLRNNQTPLDLKFGDVGGTVQDLARRLIAKHFGKLDFYALDSESMANCTIFSGAAIHSKSGNEAIAHHLLGDGYKINENGPSPLTLQRLNKFQHALDFMLSKLHTLFTERQAQQTDGQTPKPIDFSEVVRWPPRELGWDGDYTTPPNTMGMPLESMFFGESTCNAELAQAAFNRTVGRNDIFCDLLFPFQSYSMSHLDVPMYEPGFIQAQKLLQKFQSDMAEGNLVNPEHIDPQLLYKESNFNEFGDDEFDDIDVMLGDPAFRQIMDAKSTGIADTYALYVERALDAEPSRSDKEWPYWDLTSKEINTMMDLEIRDTVDKKLRFYPTKPKSDLIEELNGRIRNWGVVLSCSIVYKCLKKQETSVEQINNDDEASRKAWKDGENKNFGHSAKDRLYKRVHAKRHDGLLAQYYTPSNYMNRRFKLDLYGRSFFKKACVNMHPKEKEHTEMLALREKVKNLVANSAITQNAASVQSQTSTEGVVDATFRLMQSTKEFIESEEIEEFVERNCKMLMRSYIEPGYTSFAYTAGTQDESDDLQTEQESVLYAELPGQDLLRKDAIDSFGPETLDVMDRRITASNLAIMHKGVFGLRQLPGENFDSPVTYESEFRSYDITEAYEGGMLKLLRTAQNAFEKPGGYRAQLSGPQTGSYQADSRGPPLSYQADSHEYLLSIIENMYLWNYEEKDLEEEDTRKNLVSTKIKNAELTRFKLTDTTGYARLDSVNPLFRGEWGSQMAPLLSGKHAIGTPGMGDAYGISVTDELLNALTYNIEERYKENFIPKRLQMHVPLISSRPATEKTLSVALPCMIALLVAATTLDGGDLLGPFKADLKFQIKQSFESLTSAADRGTISESKQTILADLAIVMPHIKYLIEKGLLTAQDVPKALLRVVLRHQSPANGLYHMDLVNFETDIKEMMKDFSSDTAALESETSFAGHRPSRLSSASDDDSLDESTYGAAVVGSEVPCLGFRPVR